MRLESQWLADTISHRCPHSRVSSGNSAAHAHGLQPLPQRIWQRDHAGPHRTLSLWHGIHGLAFLPQDDLGSAVEFLGYVARPLGDRQLSQSSARAKVTSEEELVTVAGQVTTGSEKLDPCGGFP